MINLKEFKQAVLQKAMQGKLTKHLPSDGNARDLLNIIKKKKCELVANNIIKRHKLRPIKQKDVWLNIPKYWVWTKLNNILDVRDGTHETPKKISNGIPLITSKNIKNHKISFDKVAFISKRDALKINKRSKVNKYDIIMPMIGTVGNPAINMSTKVFSIKNVALIKNNKFIDIKFIYYYLLYITPYLQKNSNGAVQSFISLTKIRNINIPLPPLAEQQRIVLKVHKCFLLANTIQKERDLHQTFAHDMKQSLLLEAMKSRLTQQLPSDGNADDLLQSIQKKKQQLIQAGKIRKHKKLSPVSKNEIPFKIPKNWKWIKLGKIANIRTGTTPAKKYRVGKDCVDIPFVSPRDLDNNIITNINRSISVNKASLNKVRFAQPNSIFVVGIGTIGKTGIPHKRVAFNQQIHAINGYNKHINKFIFYWLQSNVAKNQFKIGGTVISIVNKTKFSNFIIPLPPLPEQYRIVSKLHDLFNTINA